MYYFRECQVSRIFTTFVNSAWAETHPHYIFTTINPTVEHGTNNILNHPRTILREFLKTRGKHFGIEKFCIRGIACEEESDKLGNLKLVHKKQ